MAEEIQPTQSAGEIRDQIKKIEARIEELRAMPNSEKVGGKYNIDVTDRIDELSKQRDRLKRRLKRVKQQESGQSPSPTADAEI